MHRPSFKQEETDSLRRGNKLHSEMERFHKTGERSHLSDIILRGLHMCEPPGDDLLVEWDILVRPGPMPDFTRDNSDAILAAAPVRAAGIPFTGAIDLLHARGTNRGGTEIAETRDPPGTVEVVDYKFPGKMDHAKRPDELLDTVQMPSYGKYVYAVVPDAKLVRLSHVYMPVKGRGEKRSILVDRDQVETAWKRVESLAGSVRDVARETDPEKVPANRASCRAFGRDCPAIGVCSAGKFNSLASLASLVGGASSGRMIARARGDEMTTTTTAPATTLAARLAAVKAAQAAPAPAPTPVPDAAAIAAEKARIAKAEAEAKYPGLLDKLTAIEACGLGRPAIVGELAKAYALLSGFKLEGEGYAGSGDLGGDTFSDPADLDNVLAAVKELAAARTTPATVPPPPSLLPPEAPASNPALASKPPGGVPVVVADAAGAVAAAAEGKKRATRKKAADAPAPAPVPAATPVTTDPTPAVAPSSAINLYVNCSVDGIETKSLWPIVEGALAAMTEESKSTDFRCADPNGKFGFGRWRGILAGIIRGMGSDERGIPPGNYSLDRAYGEIADVVIETMREVVHRSDGVLVVGLR